VPIGSPIDTFQRASGAKSVRTHDATCVLHASDPKGGDVALTSKYATLYEMIELRRNLDRCIEVFAVDRFRDLLGVPPGTYKLGPDFVRYVVQPAVLEVNGLSDMGVLIEPRRRHARAPIHEVVVNWWKKEGEEFRAALQEIQEAKAGRMKRLKLKEAAKPKRASSLQLSLPEPA
jgi:Initiator Replication protein